MERIRECQRTGRYQSNEGGYREVLDVMEQNQPGKLFHRLKNKTDWKAFNL